MFGFDGVGGFVNASLVFEVEVRQWRRLDRILDMGDLGSHCGRVKDDSAVTKMQLRQLDEADADDATDELGNVLREDEVKETLDAAELENVEKADIEGIEDEAEIIEVFELDELKGIELEDKFAIKEVGKTISDVLKDKIEPDELDDRLEAATLDDEPGTVELVMKLKDACTEDKLDDEAEDEPMRSKLRL